jgi:hypothetical protein
MDHACQCGCLYCTPPNLTHGGNFGPGTPKPSEGEK